ncbi:hypothetical protein TIFTF001_031018 [Ficus carica]|uniref:Secreted protein n=1 Tax=Ficus carica TaxID=3494 RepID=A0AA88DZT6_FICCA|nr:hypothetical protein TIFTF001_031018 [Ficus carica]
MLGLIGLSCTCTVTLRLITCKMEAPQSDRDTSGVSATGTLMLKSVTGMLGWANAGTNGRSPNLSGWRKSAMG